jgi:uncharacterized membrane protein YjgN (DUF898 family)
MKNYFEFTLTGKKFLPVWLLFYVLVIIPYGLNFWLLKGHLAGEKPSPYFGLVVLGVVLIALLIMFLIVKMILEHVRYKEQTVAFHGKFANYLGKILLGFLLTIITLGIYMPWFIRSIHKFIIDSSSLEGSNLQFLGKGGKLFLIFLLTAIIPIVLVALAMMRHMNTINQNFLYSVLYQGIVTILMVPYMYYFYKWMVDVRFKNYHIRWETKFLESFGKILIEVLLSMITLGIYLPLAYLRLYQYFASKTIATGQMEPARFGFDLDPWKDFTFIWGQGLLTIVTLGIYYPWAFSKIGKRFINKTYLQKSSAEVTE